MKCPVCDSDQRVLIEKHDDYQIHRCASCELIYADPMKAGDVDYYQDQRFYKLKRILTEKNIQPSLRTKWEFGRFLKFNPGKNQKLLDIGCGEGQFLFHVKKKLGYDVHGVEPDELSVAVAKDYFNIDTIYVGDFDSFYAESQSAEFDLVTFYELIEHMEDPKGFLEKVKNLVKPGGYIALSTPNAARITARLGLKEKFDYPPHHLTRWYPESLARLVENQGFEIIRHEFSPQVLRSIVTGSGTWWGGKSRGADRFLRDLADGKRYALFVMKSYLKFLDMLFFVEAILMAPLKIFKIYGASQFLLARKK